MATPALADNWKTSGLADPNRCLNGNAELSIDESLINSLKRQGTCLRLEGDFAGANQISRQLKHLFPEQSIGYTFNLNTLVTRLSWDERQTRFDDEILKDAQKTLHICRKQIDSNPGDYLGYYHCGQAHFTLTYLHALRGNYYQAGTNASNTIATLEQALEINPMLIDAKLHLGISYYYADNLPPFVKAVSRFFWFVPTGNSYKSLPYIKEVTEQGEFFRDVAKYLYAFLLSNGSDEQKNTGNQLLEELVATYPGNSRFQLRYIFELEQQGHYERSLDAAVALIITEALYQRDPVDIGLAMLWVTRSFLEMKQVNSALTAFHKIDRQVSFPSWGKAWYLLTHAQISDLQEQRSTAESLYRQVINIYAGYPSSTILDLAREGLKEPFVFPAPGGSR